MMLHHQCQLASPQRYHSPNSFPSSLIATFPQPIKEVYLSMFDILKSSPTYDPHLDQNLKVPLCFWYPFAQSA